MLHELKNSLCGSFFISVQMCRFDSNRSVIIYEYQDNPHDGADYGQTHKNITEIASKTNMPVETKIADIVFTVVAGMSAEQSEQAYKKTAEDIIKKQRYKEAFMKDHAERLAQNQKLTSEIRLGLLTSELPNPVTIDENHNDTDINIVSSHAFQDYVKKIRMSFLLFLKI